MMIYWIHYSISVIQQMAQNLKVNSAGLKKAAYNHCMPELASRTSGCLELISRAGAECKGGHTLCSLSLTAEAANRFCSAAEEERRKKQ